MISRLQRNRDGESTVLIQHNFSLTDIFILNCIYGWRSFSSLFPMNSYIRFGMEILMTNATWPVTVPVTRLHYQILFISIACFIRLELTQDRLHCTITLAEENPVKHKKTSFRCTHGSCPVSSSTSAADIGRWSCLGSSPIEFLANGGLLLGFGFWHWAQTTHIPTDVQCLLCEYTIGLSHFYLTSLYFQKKQNKGDFLW